MFLLNIPGFIATNLTGNCPDIFNMLKKIQLFHAYGCYNAVSNSGPNTFDLNAIRHVLQKCKVSALNIHSRRAIFPPPQPHISPWSQHICFFFLFDSQSVNFFQFPFLTADFDTCPVILEGFRFSSCFSRCVCPCWRLCEICSSLS